MYYAWGRSAYMVLMARPERKSPLGNSRRRWWHKIKMSLTETGWGYRMNSFGSG
jgi:hypothetical protein